MIERQILIGIVTSTEYCNQIKDIFNLSLIESSSAKRMMSWIWDYYLEKKEAPGKNAPLLFWNRAKNLPKDVAEEIENDILPSFEEEYENTSFNTPYIVEETYKYFKTRKLAVLSQNIQILIEQDKLEEAEKLTAEYKQVETAAQKLDPYILSLSEIKKREIIKAKTLLGPWLKEGQMTIIYAGYGVGKSLLSISIAYMLGLREYDIKEAEISNWQVKNPVGTLYVDGELGIEAMEERINQFTWLGKQSNKHEIKVMSIPEYQLETADSFTLSLRTNQLKIIQWLKDNPDYKLIVLDSVSTLFGLVEENDNSEWSNKINPFLRDLRALNVACLMLHHAGKDNRRGLRGASAMGAMAENIFKLIDHDDKDKNAGEAYFTLIKDKQRTSGYSFPSFSIRYIQNRDKTQTHWEITKK